MGTPLQSLLAGILDYAGLFPPAQLPLDAAVRDYIRYQQEPQHWMLGRFLCPTAKLAELADLRSAWQDSPAPFRVSALGRGGADIKDFLEGVRADLADIARLREVVGPSVEIDGYEVRLPASLYDPPRENALHALIGTTAFLIDTQGPPRLAPFFEAPGAKDAVTLTIALLGTDRLTLEARKRQRCLPPGFKLRTGGTEPATFPPADLVAHALFLACQARVLMKFTAGLHHPFRTSDPQLGITPHGFLNIFLGGVLAQAHNLPEERIRAILVEEDPRSFAFNPASLAWKNLHATGEQIENARQTLVASFGSCSFTEPRDELRTLGLLP